MKTQGVTLENTPMKDLGRLSKLITIVAVAILYAFITGLTQEIAYKKNSQSAFLFIFVFILHKGIQVDQR
ncbi:hypothetical protein K737_300294 [Holospora undulata HU1]|uniref:Uncharacterized protein n=2 Tax=Holospora TaxID=44747 RepID=A0A061JIW4_9PROT|nr:hypothetical protein K737_300294 [Holospora undulata HU1]